MKNKPIIVSFNFGNDVMINDETISEELRYELEKVAVVQDDSCHRYIIPLKDRNSFDDDVESLLGGDFDNKRGHYRTGGSICSGPTLYAEL